MGNERGDLVPWEVDLIKRARELRLEVKELEQLAASNSPQFDISGVPQLLDDLETELLKGEQVSIALLGGTGSGKSTLLNALLGARLVPTSSMRACTSVITKARWSDGDGYTATVHFVPRESWERQVDQLVSDITAHRDPDVGDGSGVGEATAISKDDQDRLRAVYGNDVAEAFMKTGDPSALVEPEMIQAAFAEGSHVIRETDRKQFRGMIKGYLDSSEHYWPIVQSVEIAGPFEVLRCGGELVDLPGLNDPNEAREATTRGYLESAKFVWVVFNMKRNLTKEMTETLRSRDLLGRLLAGGRLATITLVGTASDDIDADSDCDALGLPEDSPVDDIVRARNEKSVEIARDQLLSLVRSLTSQGGNDAEFADISESLLKSPVVTVSARDFLALQGATSSRPSISNEELTQIPALRTHFESIVTEAGPWARAVRAFAQLEAAVAELQRAVQQERAHFELSSAAAIGEREAVASALERAGLDFNDNSASVLSRLGRSLQQASETFGASLKAGAEGAVTAIGRVTNSWQHIHWATLRATSVRGGMYVSPTFGQIDLVQQVATPIIEKAIAPWVAFYDRELVQVFDEANAALETLLVDYTSAVGQVAEQQPELAASVLVQLKRLVDDVGKSVAASLSLLRSSFTKDVSQQRQQLHRVTYDNVARSLAAAFAVAGRERGTGMKYRMLATIGTAVQKSAQPEYDRVAALLLAQVRASANEVQRNLEEAVEDVVAKAEEVSTGLRRVALTPVQMDDSWIAGAEGRVDHYAERFLTKLQPPQVLIASPKGTELHSTPEGMAPAASDESPSSPFVFIDGANICSKPGKGPDIQRLRSAIDAARLFWPYHRVVTIVDRSLARYFRSRNERSQLEALEALIRDGEVIEPPPGHPGKADSMLLKLAGECDGSVLSNDSYKEFQHNTPWLSDEGRLFGYTFHPAFGWKFTPRFAVRARP